MATVSTFLRRTSAMACVTALVSGHAFASGSQEYLLAPAPVQSQPYVVETPEVVTYTPAPTEVYIQEAPAQEEYVVEEYQEEPVAYIEPNPEPVYTIQEAAPVEQVIYEPVIQPQIPEPIAVTQPAPQPVAYNPPPAAAPAPTVPVGPAPTAVAAPVAPVGGLTSSGLGGTGLILAGVGAAAVIGLVAVGLGDDDDDNGAATTTTTAGTNGTN